MDPTIQSGELLDQAPLLHMLAALLGQTLHADRLRAEALDREAELQRSDQLTGLPNRTMFLHCTAHALDLHRRDQRPLAVLLFDLDDFKAVNDTLGHASGDHLLMRVADRLRGALRPADTLARLSGDEFALLLEDGADPVAMAGRVVGAFQEPFTINGTPITISASIGVAELGPAPRWPTSTCCSHMPTPRCAPRSTWGRAASRSTTRSWRSPGPASCNCAIYCGRPSPAV
jgi:diguanylate cyclase (GGDEF)-like protein